MERAPRQMCAAIFKKKNVVGEKASKGAYSDFKTILREKSLAIYFGDSQFKRNRTFNFTVTKIYVDKRSRVR